MNKVISGFVALATVATLAVAVLAMVTMWATNQSRARTACYLTATSVESCGTPSIVERALAHYVAHVDM